MGLRDEFKKHEAEHPSTLFGKLKKSYRKGTEKRAEERVEERQAYNEAFKKARITRASREGREAGSRRWYDNLQNIGTSSYQPSRRSGNRPSARSHSNKRYVAVGGIAYPVGSKHKKSSKKKRMNNNNLFDMDFDLADNWGLWK